MDMESQSVSPHMPLFTLRSHANGGPVNDHSDLPATCAQCRRTFSPTNDVPDGFEAVCGDCKFLLLEDCENAYRNSHGTVYGRRRRRRRTMHSSSESIDNLFSQQFSQMINLAMQSESTVSDHEDQLVDDDAVGWLLQSSSSYAASSGSRGWQQMLSDTESDGFDNLDSLNGESESNISFGRYVLNHGESDVISSSAYGGDSDASMDGLGLQDTEIIFHPEGGMDLDSDTDIDPMHARSNQWDLDEDDEQGEESEWEEAEIEENIEESTETGALVSNSLTLSSDERSGYVNRHRPIEFDGSVDRESRRAYASRSLSVESVLSPSIGSLRYARLVELVERASRIQSLRRGAPPAALSYVTSMPRIVINEEHVKHDGLACAICKDLFSVGTEVNELPCFHLYHPFCIVPWLSTRNSCPLCRYELPTDDVDYEDKPSSSNHMDHSEIQSQGTVEDYTGDEAELDESIDFDRARRMLLEQAQEDSAANTGLGRNNQRGRWFLCAAAPIVSLVGIVLVLWLGSPLTEVTGRACPERWQQQSHGSSSLDQGRGDGRSSRRWWPFF